MLCTWFIYLMSCICFVNQLIHEIISEYGTDDLNLLQEKLRKMRILENIELPNSVVELLNNTKEIPAIDPVEEIDVDDNDIKATEKKEEEEGKDKDDEDKVGEEENEDDGEDPVVENRTFKVDPKLPMMVRMANLCVVGGFSVNGVAEIHSEIVKEEVFNDFYKVTKPADSCCYYEQLLIGIIGVYIHKMRCSLNFFIIELLTVVA